MIEEVVFHYFARDFFKDPKDPKISIMKTALFQAYVEKIVKEACGDRMKHPQVIIAPNGSELMFSVPVEFRDTFLRTFNDNIASTIITYLSS